MLSLFSGSLLLKYIDRSDWAQWQAQWSHRMAFSIDASLDDASRSQWRSAYGSQPSDTGQHTPIRSAQSHVSLADRGPEFLTFSCAGIACAAPLTTIREALDSAPRVASLPDSPAWFPGVFQLRTEILGVADMRPILLGHANNGNGSLPDNTYSALTGREQAIVVGKGARSLALLVESIEDILSLRPHEILSDLVEHPAFGAIAPRYRLGLLSPEAHQTRFALVALDTLLTDALNALTDPEAAANE
jgi:chemotaxis signal transduction protein